MWLRLSWGELQGLGYFVGGIQGQEPYGDNLVTIGQRQHLN